MWTLSSCAALTTGSLYAAGSCGDTVTSILDDVWISVSRPCGTAGNPTIAELFGSNLGTYGNDSNWFMQSFDGHLNGATLYTPITDPNTVMEPGIGYWLITNTLNAEWTPGANASGQTWDVDTTGTSDVGDATNDIVTSAFNKVLIVDPTATLTPSLTGDAQQVLLGNPSPTPFKWSDVHFSLDGTGGVGFESVATVTSGIRNTAYIYSAGEAGQPYRAVASSGTPGLDDTIGANGGFWIMLVDGAHVNKRVALPYVSSLLDPIPANIVLSGGRVKYIASLYDTDYLPYSTPIGPATTSAVVADGSAEATTIDVQGMLDTTGTTLYIPYVVTTASVNLPAYTQTVNVPASLTEDGISRDVTLSYNAKTLAVGAR